MSEYAERDRFLSTIAVFVVVLNDKQEVLLQRRANTDYMDGYYDFASGHLEAGETLTEGTVREAKEEVGVTIDERDLELFHVNQNTANAVTPYMNFVFRTEVWTGTPQLCEPNKCDDVGFFPIDALPRVTPQVRRALADIATAQVTFSYFTEADFEVID